MLTGVLWVGVSWFACDFNSL